jgi:hypothetical protein
MLERIKCPSCGVALLLPVPLRGSRGTCPRCLAEVTALEVRREPGSIQAERPEWREGALSCPRCGRTVEAFWITCPWCEEPLRGRERGRNSAADLDVRRDMKGTSCFVIALAVIGGLGGSSLGVGAIVSAANGGPLDPAYFDPESALYFWACLLLPLLFLAGLSTLIVFVRSRGNPGARGVRRVIVGTLALTGGVILVSLLLCLAFVVFLCIACSMGGGPQF